MILLGSTGSIGTNTLSIARRFNLKIDVLVAGRSIDKLNKQIAEFSPRMVVIANQEDVAKATFFPHSMAFSVGLKPKNPTKELMTKSESELSIASSIPSSPKRTFE